MPLSINNNSRRLGIKKNCFLFLIIFYFSAPVFSQTLGGKLVQENFVTVTPKAGKVSFKKGKDWIQFTKTKEFPESAWIRLEGIDGNYVVVNGLNCAQVKDTGNTQLNQLIYVACNSNSFFKDFLNLPVEQEKRSAPISPKQLVYGSSPQKSMKASNELHDTAHIYKEEDVAKVESKEPDNNNGKINMSALDRNRKSIIDAMLGIGKTFSAKKSIEWKKDPLFDSTELQVNTGIASELTDSLKLDSIISIKHNFTTSKDEITQLDFIRFRLLPDVYFKSKVSIYMKYGDFSGANQTFIDAVKYYRTTKAMLSEYREFIKYMRMVYEEKFQRIKN